MSYLKIQALEQYITELELFGGTKCVMKWVKNNIRNSVSGEPF